MRNCQHITLEQLQQACKACELALLQDHTLLVMDHLENGDLWAALGRKDRSGRHVFQFQQRGGRAAYEIALGLCYLHGLKYGHAMYCLPDCRVDAQSC